jgi:hypothetical protein
MGSTALQTDETAAVLEVDLGGAEEPGLRRVDPVDLLHPLLGSGQPLLIEGVHAQYGIHAVLPLRRPW